MDRGQGSQPEADQGGLASILRRQSIVWIGARLWPPLLAGRRQEARQRGRAMACTSGRCNGERGGGRAGQCRWGRPGWCWLAGPAGPAGPAG